jgi:hypothetical protein
MRFLGFLFLPLIICFMPLLKAQNDIAKAYVDKTGIFIGDQFDYFISVNVDGNTVIERIETDTLTKYGFEIIEIAPAKLVTANEQIVALKLTTFEVGEKIIPPLPIYLRYAHAVKDTTSTNAVKIHVYPVNANSTSIAPFKSIIEEEKNWQDDWHWLVILVVVLVSLIFFLKKYLRKNTKKAEKIVIAEKNNPNDVFLNHLEKIKNEKNASHFASQLTIALRNFLEQKYHFPANTMTTERIITHCQTTDLLAEKTENLQHLLYITDYVKFANGDVENDFFTKSLADAKSFIE